MLDLEKKDVRAIVDEYTFPRIEGSAGDWPQQCPCDLALLVIVDNYCSELEECIPKPITPTSLSSSPGSYIPGLKFMLREYENVHSAANATKNVNVGVIPKLYSIFPNPSLAWRFVSLNAGTLASFFNNIQTPNRPSDYSQMFFEICDMSVLRMRRYTTKH